MKDEKCSLSDKELIAKANEWTLKLCENHNNWILRVPPDLNHDPDMIFSELADRLEAYITKYEKCINVIKRFDAGIIGMYDL